MSNKNVIFVPVDPKMYGLGMGIGCLIRFWKQVFGFLMLLGLIFWIGSAVYSAKEKKKEQARQQVAMETAVVESTQVTEKTNELEEGFSRLKQIQQEQQLLSLNSRIDLDSSRYAQLNSLVFAPDGLRIYLESRIDSSWMDPADSCLIWKGTNPVNGANEWNNYDASIDGGQFVRPIYASFTNSDPQTHPSGGFSTALYEGYVLFPTEVLPESYQQLALPGVYYLAFGCKSGKNVEIPVVDLTAYAAWETEPFQSLHMVGFSTRENHPQGNSALTLENLERVSTINVLVKFTLQLDENASSFVLADPEDVYLEFNGERFRPEAWGGLFIGEDKLTFQNNRWYWQQDDHESGWIIFGNAWGQLQNGGCFNLHLGEVFLFDNICLNQ